MEATRNKISMLEQARAAGFQTVINSSHLSDEGELSDEMPPRRPSAIRLRSSPVAAAAAGARPVDSPDHLSEIVRRAHVEAKAVYGKQPAFPGASHSARPPGRRRSWPIDTAASYTGRPRRLNCPQQTRRSWRNRRRFACRPKDATLCWKPLSAWPACSTIKTWARWSFWSMLPVSFTSARIKSRIQIDHTLSEMVTRVDLIREQIRLAAGEALGYGQDDVTCHGWAMMCRVQAEDPARRYMPASGHLRRVRPGGPEVRVDTYLYCDSEVPSFYDPLIAKATRMGDRPAGLCRSLAARAGGFCRHRRAHQPAAAHGNLALARFCGR